MTQWIDEAFEQNRQRQYPRELFFSSVVELMALGLRPSLLAAARTMADRLPVSLAALYAKVKRTEPALLRALVHCSAQRLAPVVAGLEVPASLPGWQVRVINGNHLNGQANAGYVSASTARAHVSIDRVLRASGKRR